jgi:hypothetical protein
VDNVEPVVAVDDLERLADTDAEDVGMISKCF